LHFRIEKTQLPAMTVLDDGSGRSSPLVPSSSAPALPYSRSRIDMAVVQSPRARPPTEMRIKRLKHNLRPPSSLSPEVRYANVALLRSMQVLADVDRANWVMADPHPKPTKLPPIGKKGSSSSSSNLPQSSELVSDISAMLRESSALYAGAQSRLAPVPKKEDEEAAKKAKPKAKPSRSGAAAGPSSADGIGGGSSRISSRSEATLYVREMLDSLRSDDGKRQQFESKVAAILEEQGKGLATEKIRANVREESGSTYHPALAR
jgi:hypothetical protein